MKHLNCNCITFYCSSKHGKALNKYRVIESLYDRRLSYSLFVSSETDGTTEESFVPDITDKLLYAVKLCRFLCRKGVCAAHASDIIADNLMKSGNTEDIFSFL